MNNFPPEIKAYRPIALCGRGAYGSVYLAADAVGVRYALKIVEKNAIGGSWEREFRGLKHYRTRVPEHPNLIRIFHIEDCGDFFYYTMEAADNISAEPACTPMTLTNLIRHCGRLAPDTLREIFDALLDALQHLHAAKVIHRDVKPDNILFVHGNPKLGDIGLLDTATHTLSLAGTQDFVPPEYLLDRDRKPAADIDLYALGKTLYCAFSGNTADCFPCVPPELLKDPEYRIFNRLVREACTPERMLRVRSIAAFRRMLHGEIGWKYEFRRLLYRTTIVPAALFVACVRFVFTRKWFLLLLLLLGVVWCVMVIGTYWRMERELYPYETGFHASAFRRALKEWHAQLGRYDLYDMEPKTEFSIRRYGERHLVTKDEYLQAKHAFNPGSLDFSFDFEVGDPDEKGSVRGTEKIHRQQNSAVVRQDQPLKYQYLYEKVFDRLHGGDLSVPDDTRWSDGTMWLPAGKRKAVKYLPELPLITEINLAFNPYGTRGNLEFVLTAAEYLPFPKQPLPDVQWKKQMRFLVTLSGDKMTFNDIIWRGQDKSEDEIWFLESPQIKELMLEDRYYQLKIVTADSYYRVYVDDKLVWGTRKTFFGGYFELRYQTNHILPVNHFSVYNTGIVQPGEKRRSRLKLPKAPPPAPKESKARRPKEPDAASVQDRTAPLSFASAPAPVSAPAQDRTAAPAPDAAPAPAAASTPAAVSAPVSAPASAPAPAPSPASGKTHGGNAGPAVRRARRASAEPRRTVREAVKKEAEKPAAPPRKMSARELTRREYKYVQEDIADLIANLDRLKDSLPDYRHIAEEEVVIEQFYEHEKGGRVYEFRIPPQAIRGSFRMMDWGPFHFRGFLNFHIGDREIKF